MLVMAIGRMPFKPRIAVVSMVIGITICNIQRSFSLKDNRCIVYKKLFLKFGLLSKFGSLFMYSLLSEMY